MEGAGKILWNNIPCRAQNPNPQDLYYQVNNINYASRWSIGAWRGPRNKPMIYLVLVNIRLCLVGLDMDIPTGISQNPTFILP